MSIHDKYSIKTNASTWFNKTSTIKQLTLPHIKAIRIGLLTTRKSICLVT